MELREYGMALTEEKKRAIAEMSQVMETNENCKGIVTNINHRYKELVAAYKDGKLCGVMAYIPFPDTSVYLDVMCSMCPGAGKFLIDYLKKDAPKISAYVLPTIVGYYRKQGFEFTKESKQERETWIAKTSATLGRPPTVKDEIAYSMLWEMEWHRPSGGKRSKRKHTTRHNANRFAKVRRHKTRRMHEDIYPQTYS